MSEGVVLEREREGAKSSCQHHWIIETPHGVTSRGTCKQCGVSKRFPNAAEDALGEGRGMGRWSSGRKSASSSKISASGSSDKGAA